MDITYLERPTYKGQTDIVIVRTKAPEFRALLAMELLGKWGLVAALPDGEDSAGRQKLKVHAPEDLVARACEIADRAYQEFCTRGWMLELPLPKIGETK